MRVKRIIKALFLIVSIQVVLYRVATQIYTHEQEEVLRYWAEQALLEAVLTHANQTSNLEGSTQTSSPNTQTAQKNPAATNLQLTDKFKAQLQHYMDMVDLIIAALPDQAHTTQLQKIDKDLAAIESTLHSLNLDMKQLVNELKKKIQTAHVLIANTAGMRKR